MGRTVEGFHDTDHPAVRKIKGHKKTKGKPSSALLAYDLPDSIFKKAVNLIGHYIIQCIQYGGLQTLYRYIGYEGKEEQYHGEHGQGKSVGEGVGPGQQ
jgi:hypothetical protein